MYFIQQKSLNNIIEKYMKKFLRVKKMAGL